MVNKLAALMGKREKVVSELEATRKNNPETVLAAELQTVDREIARVEAEEDRRQVEAWAAEIESTAEETERILIDYARSVYAQVEMLEAATNKVLAARDLALKRPDDLSAARASAGGRYLVNAHERLIAWLFVFEHGAPKLADKTGYPRKNR